MGPIGAVGGTSERQAGQWNVPSGKRRISGWPHSQACFPRASGRAAICSSVPRMVSSKAQPQESQLAGGPDARGRSSPDPHTGQTRWSGLDGVAVVRDGPFDRFITLPSLSRLPSVKAPNALELALISMEVASPPVHRSSGHFSTAT